MAKSKKPPKYVLDLVDRVAAIETKLADFSAAGQSLGEAISKEIRSIVEGEVDDLLSDLRIER